MNAFGSDLVHPALAVALGQPTVPAVCLSPQASTGAIN
jgi:hypothetical protein